MHAIVVLVELHAFCSFEYVFVGSHFGIIVASLEFFPVDNAAILPGKAVSRKTCCKRAAELGFSTFGASH